MNIHEQDKQGGQPERKRRISGLHIALLWSVTLAWIVLIAIVQHDSRISVFGGTIELLAIVSCLHITWFIRTDHNRHARRREESVARIDVQPFIDVAEVFRAGWIARDMERPAAEPAQTAPAGNVYRFDRQQAEQIDRHLSAMRRPTAPVPPQRQTPDFDRSDTA